MTETQENPLVAKSESPDGFWTGMGDPAKSEPDRLNAQTGGSGLFSDAASTLTDARKGDWGNLAMDAATDGLDLLGAAMDPLGTLASAGVGWLIEHISFLKEGLDLLAGNPEAVTAKAVTWDNIAKQLIASADQYEKSASEVGKSFSDGGGAVAYQATAKTYSDTLRGASGHAQDASKAMNVGAALVGVERGLIRDLISSFVGELIIKGLAALATSWCSFGGTIAAFIADTVLEGAALAERIGSKIAKVVEKLETLAKSAGKAGAAIESAANALRKVGKGVSKIADKGLNAAVKIDSKAGELKQAGAEWKALSSEEKAAARTAKVDGWNEAAEHSVPGREHVEGLGKTYSEDGRNLLNQKKLRDPSSDISPNIADGTGVIAEGRRQENEQIDRYKEGTEAYEKEHPEGESEAKPAGE
ncbi:hypothetical protein [Amycolatopsis sp. H20-H5]|uniref:hypothetical protein n=1 Tax=Amycolatopsis sp. H20-H5 TaxID=3046309 RepID=UPI002DBB521F|nr:hypothetical protein [Amycolatopsis sp. H20-H5]MEC3977223.1 hypothetical protein [Amycolatopsis sp. H20-H5]